MAFMQRSCNRITSLLTRFNPRYLSQTDLTLETDIKKSVFISQSNDIYTNLALEEWIYKNFNFEKHHILMLWQNNPCVVIGRNQNPWSETNFFNLQNLTENGVNIARRSSGGGAVFHDNGILNLTFFTPTERYDSKKNNEIVMRSIFREFGCNVDIAVDNHLLLRKNKEEVHSEVNIERCVEEVFSPQIKCHSKQVSNNAAKVGREKSYHNISLMVKSSKSHWTLALQKHDVQRESRSKDSVPLTKLMNLCEESPSVTISSLMKAVGWEYLRAKVISGKDAGMEFASQQRGFHMINPSEGWFPGIQEIRDTFNSWDWCYGKTPKFTITQSFAVPTDLLHTNTGAAASLYVTITVENGRIADISMFIPQELNSFGFTGEAKVVHNLKGKKFTAQAFEDLEDSLGCLLNEKDRFVTECLKKVMVNA